MNTSNFFKLFCAIAIAESAGIIGSIFTIPAISSWYLTLEKPLLSPPNWIFGPVWMLLYLLMGIASFLILQKGFKRKDVKIALAVFALQLALNAIWSVIFFGFKNPFFALLEIVVLWAAILGTVLVFMRVSRVAATLLLPYMLWVSFAVYLNYAIWRLNG